jgi:hypothetical protein
MDTEIERNIKILIPKSKKMFIDFLEFLKMG